MLRHLRVRDFAIIDEVNVELSDGMCILTGETGAGKSILIDALGLVLGDRADSGSIRHTSERMEISALFTIDSQTSARRWLAERDKEENDECILRRVVTRDGGSRAYINGSATTLASLRELGEMLVEVYGQNEHQTLLRRDKQRELLDSHARHEPLLQDVRLSFLDWRETEKRIESLSGNQHAFLERRDLLRFQVNELESMALFEGELATLETQHSRLANAEQLLTGAQTLFNTLYEDENSLYSLGARQLDALQTLAGLDTHLRPLCEHLESSQVLLRDCAEELRDYAEQLEIDPHEFARVEQRLAAYHELARKHRVRPEALVDKLAQLLLELHGLEDSGATLEQLHVQREAQTNRYIMAAKQLSDARRANADTLSHRVTALMQELGMPDGRFSIEINSESDSAFSANGLDRIEFTVSTNGGQPLKPLAKIASGGELSRISLAIQVAGMQKQDVATLVFDEVDAGIGGGVAEIVGRKLRLLGNQYQVLCVTHLPQVAAQGHVHYHVRKVKKAGQTRTTISTLQDSDRILEIARMLGGLEMTENTQNHAQEMIARAQQSDHHINR